MNELMETGDQHLAEGKFHEAVLCFQRVFEDMGLRARALNCLGLCFEGLRYRIESETAFLKAIAVLNGSDPQLEKEVQANLARLTDGTPVPSPEPVSAA